MVSLKKIRKSTLIIVLSVILLSIFTLRTTYSYIFSVKSNASVQTFKAGTLDISITESKQMTEKLLMPATGNDYPTSLEAVPELDSNNSYATLSIKNNGSLDAKFSVSIDYDTNLPDGTTIEECKKDKCVNFQYLIIGIYDSTSSKWVNFASDGGAEVAYTQVGSLTANTDGSYPILTGTVKSTQTNNYQIFIWLSDTTPYDEIGKLAYLKLNVKSTPVGQSENA